MQRSEFRAGASFGDGGKNSGNLCAYYLDMSLSISISGIFCSYVS
ncbi:hypothetical protein [Paenibacillus macerans]|nr:hypothetical protein [Paenibacillus macerans]